MADHADGATAFAVHVFDYPSDNKHHRTPLPNTAHAASAIRETLAKHLPSEQTFHGSSAPLVAGEIERWMRDARPDDRLILYLAGHGEVHGNDFFVVDADTPPDWLAASTAVSASALTHTLTQTEAGRVLVIIDGCYSGEAGAVIAAGLDAHFRRRNPRPGFAAQVITSATQGARAPDGLFAETFHRVLHSEARWGPNDRFIHTPLFVEAIEDALEADHGGTYANSVQLRGPKSVRRMLPNPNHHSVPDVEVAFKQLAREHFMRSASGLEITESGWFFTGRRAILTEIVTWMRSSVNAGGMLVVTGPPGAGKSAVVGRLALLADPATRATVLTRSGLDAADPTVPGERAIDLGLHAREKTLEQVSDAVAAALGLPIGTAIADLIASTRQHPWTLLVDALDEAAGDVIRIAEFLRDLAAAGARVIVGSRPDRAKATYRAATGPLLAALGPHHRIDLGNDGAPAREQTQRDIADYVALRLRSEPSPYLGQPNLEAVTATVGRAVAERVSPSFLYARLAAHALVSTEAPILPTGDWQRLLPDVSSTKGFSAEVERDLGRIPDRVRPRVRTMLMALAWAEGAGFPRYPIWTAAAEAITGETYADRDVRDTLRHAAWYLVESSEADETVYRLYHEELIRYFREATRREH